jgi:glycosyltransferase involved in cell wall biosynthesis
MNIWIVGDSFGFPNGGGASARVYTYAKGLVENGATVRVLCLSTSERSELGILNTQVIGTYDGIPYEYTCGETVRAKSFLGRRWLELKGAIGFVRSARAVASCGKLDAVIVFSNSAFWILWVFVASRLLGAKCIQEKSEFPFVYDKKDLWHRLYSTFYIRTIYKLFDGMIVISTYLEDYFGRRVRKGVPILRVPILVNVDSLGSVTVERIDDRRRIVYLGNLGHTGEVLSLIHAFAMAADEYPDWCLQIIGNTSDQALLAQIHDLLHQLQLTNKRVELAGEVRRVDLPSYLCAADVMVLLRSSGVFSQAGFPTKLGEYLATGRPVIVTATGDIPLYLQDGVSAFLSTPGDIGAFVTKLKHVLSHYDEAVEVGRRGQEVARQYFDYRKNCRRILDFVYTLRAKDCSSYSGHGGQQRE